MSFQTDKVEFEGLTFDIMQLFAGYVKTILPEADLYSKNVVLKFI